jgi:hypothetical protein
MPLVKSANPKFIGENVEREEDAGRPYRQALAIALSTQDRAKREGGGAIGRAIGIVRHRAAGGSSGTPAAPTLPTGPTVPTYATAPSGILSSGLMPTPQVGSYTLDPNTGALTQASQQALQTYAQRGLPITGTPAATPATSQAQQIANELQMGFDGGQSSGGTQSRGGRVPRLASGGVPTSAEMAPWYVRRESYGMDSPAGLVHTAGAGRTDNVPMSVASGSHVLPADVVAGIGSGNTLAGAHALEMALRSGPGGISLPRGPSHSTIPRPPPLPRLARGGKLEWEGHPIRVVTGHVPPEQGGIKCILAGGEWLLKPDEVKRIKYKGKEGHDAVDSWIMDMRRENIKKLKKLPGPVKS